MSTPFTRKRLTDAKDSALELGFAGIQEDRVIAVAFLPNREPEGSPLAASRACPLAS